MTLSLLVSAVAAMLSVGADTSSRFAGSIETPTILGTPVTGVRGVLLADSIVVEKSRHTLTLFSAGRPIRTYLVALGKQPVGDKIKKGDGRTPEGIFRIDARNPDSKYHKALHISYPDAYHAQRASALGVPAGGDIMIHGLPRGYEKVGAEHREFDWTEGCIALTNAEIEEIWRAVPVGAPIQIKP